MRSAQQVVELIDEYLLETRTAGRSYDITISDFVPGKALLGLPAEERVLAVVEAIPRLIGNLDEIARRGTVSSMEPRWYHNQTVKELVNTLLRQKRLPFMRENVEDLLESLKALKKYEWSRLPGTGILRVLEEYVEANGMSHTVRAKLEQFANVLRNHPTYADVRKAFGRMDSLLYQTSAKTPVFELTTDEAWTRHLRQHLQNLEINEAKPWNDLMRHCATARSSKPSRKWLRVADLLISTLGVDVFASVACGVLAEIGKPGTPQVQVFGGHEYQMDATLIQDQHSDLLRGLVWATSLVPQETLITAVGDAAEACFRKLPGFGPRAPKIGNACLFVLSQTTQAGAVGQLSRLKTRVKHRSVRSQLGKALDAAAQKAGVSTAELEEISVPTCGLTSVGEFHRQVGGFTVQLKVTDRLRSELSWQKPDGKVQASMPTSIKESHAADIKTIKQIEKEIGKLLPAQRDRLEQLLWQRRDWSSAEFRARFFDHPLVGTLARRLIWRFSDGIRVATGIWSEGMLVTERDSAIDWLKDDTRVSLWHPLNSTVEQVTSWRDWLHAHQVRQPFKQAYREIYVLTDAERSTATYSNRFAAHIIRQHQFQALCQQRGWLYTLQGAWDSANTPTLHVPQWDMSVEFWVEAAPEGNEMGVFLHLATDQVRFYKLGEASPLRLEEVPPLVFSEVMRDVDLFVGVASVGNDPNWSDGGPEGRYRAYWQSYSFGDLSASAQTRKAVLERIIPRLKIATRCSFSDKFLVVKGDRRTYKIHLGSGNILMLPNDQYLCIVPQRGTAAKCDGNIYLPFEGDTMLSIILSKAFLLADDGKITDPTITSQLKK